MAQEEEDDSINTLIPIVLISITFIFLFVAMVINTKRNKQAYIEKAKYEACLLKKRNQ